MPICFCLLRKLAKVNKKEKKHFIIIVKFIKYFFAENIKVRFFETDENEEIIWEDWGNFTEADVHHQYAIALRTPPYYNKDIEHKVNY